MASNQLSLILDEARAQLLEAELIIAEAYDLIDEQAAARLDRVAEYIKMAIKGLGPDETSDNNHMATKYPVINDWESADDF